jgi:hypothetical protein
MVADMVKYLAAAIFDTSIATDSAERELTDADVEAVAGDMLDYINHNLEILVNEVYDEVFTLMLQDLWLVVRMLPSVYGGKSAQILLSTGVELSARSPSAVP